MPTTFELNGTEYEARLSPGAVLAMQQQTGKLYPEILRGMIGEGERPADPLDVLAFCAACLQTAWPGLTGDALWEALRMSNLTHYNSGLLKLLALARALLEIDAPQADEVDGDAGKNAPTPAAGAGAASPAISTASSVSVIRGRCGRSRSVTTRT